MIFGKIISKKMIGKGTFGKVYKVNDEKGSVGALKVIDKQYHNYRIQFKSAYEITRKIDDINYVKAYQWLSDKDVSWVMEYVDGKPVSALKFTTRSDLDEILKAMIQVCNGLIALHSRNIIHRDLKPQNILIDQDKIVKITDFDFVKTEQTGKQISQFVGTPYYASPEHFISSYDLDIRSDLYSLGVILYELVTGKLPFTGKDAKEIGDKHRLKPIILPSKINPDIPQGVEKIIAGLLEKNPKDRYQHTHAVAMDLYEELHNKKGVKIKEDIPYLLKPRFVNRETPLQTLNTLSDKLKNKNGKVVLVLGESGIGKSKLIQKFYHYLQLQNVDFHHSVCKLVEHSFEPLSSIFEEILGSIRTEAKKLKYFGKFGWDLVTFRILKEKEWMKKIEKPVKLSGKGAEIRLFSAITHIIQKAAAKPLVICMDDLQWADEIILKWLFYAERNLQKFPVIIVGLHRTEQLAEDSMVLKIENLIQVKVKNLKSVDISDMIRSMLGKKSSSKELNNFIKSIISHTKGNPLFIREILYFLQEKGKITIENNKWKFPLDPEMKELPRDIHKIILERLHQLSNESLFTLQAASVIGKKFNYEMLLNMTQKNENELLADLIDCQAVSLIEESGSDYSFIHDKVQEVVEREIKEKHPTIWKKLHLKAGEFLEEKYSANPDEVMDELANHFYYAEQVEKSIKYNELAGDRAKRSYLNNKALNFYEHLIKNIEEQLLTLFKKELKYKEKSGTLIDILLKKSNLLQLIGSWKKAEEVYRNALTISEKIEDINRTAISYNCLGDQLYKRSNYEEAMECFENSLTICEKLGNEEKKELSIVRIGDVYSRKGDYDKALECYEKCLRISKQHRNKSRIALILGEIGLVSFYKANYSEAMEYYMKKLKLSEELGLKREIADVVMNIGGVYYFRGHYEKALECCKKYIKIWEEIGGKWEVSSAITNMASIYIIQDKYIKAMKCCKSSLLVYEELGDQSLIATTLVNIANIYYLQGNYMKALEYFGKAIKIAIEIGENRNLPLWLYSKALTLYKMRRFEDAYRANEEAIKMQLKMKEEEYFFKSKILNAKIAFKTNSRDLQIKNCIKPLEKMLNETKVEEQIADLNYELALMNNEINNKTNANKHKRKALVLFKKLYKNTPKIGYKEKIEKLEKLKIQK